MIAQRSFRTRLRSVLGSSASLARAVGLFAALISAGAVAATAVSGSISQNAEWTTAGSPYVVTGQLTVDNGAQLTIDAGVAVQMNAAAGLEVVNGALAAQGTASSPIAISSAAASPARGDWGTVTFDAGTLGDSTTLTHVNVRYGHGIVVKQSSPSFRYVSIDHHIGPAMSIDLASSPVGDHLTASDNDLNGILVPAGEIGSNVSWLLTGIPYVVQQGAVTVGKRSFSLVSSRLRVAPGATGTLELDIPDVAPAGGSSVGLSSSNTSVATVPATAAIAEGVQTANVTVTGAAIGSSTITASHAAYGTATAIVDVVAPPTVTLSPQSTSVSLGHSTSLLVTLSEIAPAGGTRLALSVNDPTLASFPTQVTVAPGQKSASFSVQGLAQGAATISATAQGFVTGSATVLVKTQSLTLPASIVVPPSGNVTATITLSDPAPVGGLTISLSSANPAIATVPATITVQQSGGTASFAVTGLAQGTTTLTATAPGFAAATSAITVSAISISFNPSTTLFIPQERSQSVQVKLSKAAPAGGVVVSLSMSDPTLASVWPTQVTVPAGQTVSPTSVAVTGIQMSWDDYSLLTAQAPGLTTGTTRVWVEGIVGVDIYDNFSDDGITSIVGKGLTYSGVAEVQLYTVDGSFYPTPTPLTVNLTSSDPTLVTVPASVTIPAGRGDAYFDITGVELTQPGQPVTITVSAPGMPTLGTLAVSVVTPQLQYVQLDGNRNIGGGGRDDFNVTWLVPNSYRFQTASTAQNLSLSVASTPDGIVPGFHDAAVGGNPTSAIGIAVGKNGTTNPLYVDVPTVPGTYAITASLLGVGSWTSAPQLASNAGLQFFDTSTASPVTSKAIGKGLQPVNLSVALTGSNGQPVSTSSAVTVRLTSGDPSKVSVPAQIIIPAGASSIHCPVSGVDLTTSAVTVTADATGYPSAAMSLDVVAPTLVFAGLDGARATFASLDNFTVQWAGNQTPVVSQTIALSIVNANPSTVVTLNSSAVTINPGSNSSETDYVSQPNGSGSYQVQATLAGVGTWTSAVQTSGGNVLGFAVGMTGPINVGLGLSVQAQVSAVNGTFIGTPASPIPVTLTSSDPAVTVSPSTVTIPASCCGGAFAKFLINGVSISSAPVTITATAAGYTSPPPITASVVMPVLNFSGLDGARTTISDRDNFFVYWTVAGGPGGQVASSRQTVALSIAEPNPSTIIPGFHDNSAQFISNPITQVTIPVGKNDSQYAAGLNNTYSYVDQATSTGTYKVQADLAGMGSWTSPQQTVAIPSLALGGNGTVYIGQGLLDTDPQLTVATVGYMAAPLAVSLNCLDSSICSVPPTVTFPSGSPFAHFDIQGLGVGTTHVEASASGFNSANNLTVVVVKPTLQLANVPSILAAGATASLQAFFSIPNANGLMPTPSDLVVSLSSSNSSVLDVPATAVIPAGQSVSAPISLNAISPGQATITVSDGNLVPFTTQPIMVQ